MTEGIEIRIGDQCAWQMRTDSGHTYVELLRNHCFVAVYFKGIPKTKQVLEKGLNVMLEEVVEFLELGKIEDLIFSKT